MVLCMSYPEWLNLFIVGHQRVNLLRNIYSYNLTRQIISQNALKTIKTPSKVKLGRNIGQYQQHKDGILLVKSVFFHLFCLSWKETNPTIQETGDILVKFQFCVMILWPRHPFILILAMWLKHADWKLLIEKDSMLFWSCSMWGKMITVAFMKINNGSAAIAQKCKIVW